MPLQATSGAASYDGFGGGVPAAKNYIEDVFSTYLYTGNGSTQTITNGIDLAGKGGLTWVKPRSVADWHNLYDTARGASKSLATNATDAQYDLAGNGVSAFGSTGFTINGSNDQYNTSGQTYASWTFRKQPKFFDVVTFSGNSASGRQIAHSLGSAPGCIIVKNLTNADEWLVWHRSLNDFAGSGNNLVLNTTAAQDTGGYFGVASTQTSTYFTVNANVTKINWSGNNYVAYLFAHNAGGFGLTGTDNVISCGSYTGNGSATGPVVTLGYEPQFVMIKNTTAAGNWVMLDVMRGLPVGDGDAVLYANVTNAETSLNYVNPLSTGFQLTASATYVNTSGSNYIYIAIRRGPMKVPTSGSSVFTPFATRNASNGTASQSLFTTNYPIDWMLQKNKAGSISIGVDRLRGTSPYLSTDSTAAETANTFFKMDSMIGVYPSSTATASSDLCSWIFRRAPSFFDEVCYTGTGTNTTQTHNLGVVPEMIIVKKRSVAADWEVYQAALGATNIIELNLTGATSVSATRWNNTAPTSSVFSLGTHTTVNASGATYVAYLFATCAGVSKVFSYTGNGSSQTINCGFTGGARWILIKRTDSTGDWYVWDSARGIVSGNDPHLSLNTTAAEVTTDDTIDTDSTGFVVNQVSATNVNVSSATYVGIAIA